MNIIGFSDLHGNLDNLDLSNQDLAIVPGDFSNMYGFGKWHLYKQKEWIQKKFFAFIEKYPKTHFVVIPGNHDLCLDSNKTNCYSELDWNLTLPENVHLLNNSGIIINNLTIYGIPNIPIISYRWAFESEHDKLVEVFSKIPENLDLLLTHAPPRIPGSDIDRSIQYGNPEHFGSSELTNAIFEKSPRYVFCGHIHSGDHNCCEFGKSKIYNVSRLDEDYKIAYDPLKLEI